MTSGNLGASLVATPSVGDLKAYVSLLNDLEPTPPNVEGPFYKGGAPYRAKVSPPKSPGVPLVITGRLLDLDTASPLAGAQIHVWQADAAGQYFGIEGDPSFHYRVRLITDERGRYEFETVHPAPYYSDGLGKWRAPHLHFLVQALGFCPLITQLFFSGDARQGEDPFFDKRLMIPLKRVGSEPAVLEEGWFEIVMSRNPGAEGR